MRKNFLNFAFNFYGPGFEIAKIHQEIYSKRESENSQRNFRFERTREINSRALSKIFNKEEVKIS
jgi:hypothetical protein